MGMHCLLQSSSGTYDIANPAGGCQQRQKIPAVQRLRHTHSAGVAHAFSLDVLRCGQLFSTQVVPWKTSGNLYQQFVNGLPTRCSREGVGDRIHSCHDHHGILNQLQHFIGMRFVQRLKHWGVQGILLEDAIATVGGVDAVPFALKVLYGV